MSEKNEKQPLKNEIVPAKSPSNQNEVPGPPPVDSIEVSQSEQDLDLLKEELPKLSDELINNFLPDKEEGNHQDSLANLLGPENPTEELVEETFPEETVFKYPVDGMERTAYENILKANRETIKKLRTQLQESLATTEALRAELEAKNTKE